MKKNTMGARLLLLGAALLSATGCGQEWPAANKSLWEACRGPAIPARITAALAGR